jgi:hypothetical protein
MFAEINPTAVEDYLLEQRLSNSCRNTIIYTLKLVMREAKRAGVIQMIPEFEPFKRNGRRQDILSSKELIKLFPYDEKELIEIWKRPESMRKEQPEIALMFGSGGLSRGETVCRTVLEPDWIEFGSKLIYFTLKLEKTTTNG